MQRDLDSQASFEDEHYFLHIPLLFGPLCIFYYTVFMEEDGWSWHTCAAQEQPKPLKSCYFIRAPAKLPVINSSRVFLIQAY